MWWSLRIIIELKSNNVPRIQNCNHNQSHVHVNRCFLGGAGYACRIVMFINVPCFLIYPAGVASSIPVCSEMGVAIMDQGGSVVDAAITTMLCVGLINSQNSGIGG